MPMFVLLSQNAQSDEKLILSRCTNQRRQTLLDDGTWKSLLIVILAISCHHRSRGSGGDAVRQTSFSATHGYALKHNFSA